MALTRMIMISFLVLTLGGSALAGKTPVPAKAKTPAPAKKEPKPCACSIC